MKQILSLIIILSVILLTGCANSNTISSPLVNTTPTVEVSTPTKNVAGLNDVVNVGDLSVKLFMVKLTTLNLSITTELNGNISAKTYLMLWFFNVTNTGESIQYISSCGTLLFEDGSQYDFDGDTNNCGDYKIVPGATITIDSMFYFSNGFLYKGTEMSWENVSGSKITYFSEQSRGLIKYVIDQNELENVN